MALFGGSHGRAMWLLTTTTFCRSPSSVSTASSSLELTMPLVPVSMTTSVPRCAAARKAAISANTDFACQPTTAYTSVPGHTSCSAFAASSMTESPTALTVGGLAPLGIGGGRVETAGGEWVAREAGVTCVTLTTAADGADAVGRRIVGVELAGCETAGGDATAGIIGATEPTGAATVCCTRAGVRATRVD